MAAPLAGGNDPSAGPLLPDYLAPGLDVIVVGAAPSLAAAASGHYYDGPRNRFWHLLHQAGFTPRLLDPAEDETILRYGMGLTGIMLDQISTDNSRLPPPSDEQRAVLRQKLLDCAPRFVCYNGKDVYRMSGGAADCPWGLQEETLGGSRLFVVHSSSGRADGWGADRLYLYRELRSLVDAARK